MKPKVESLLKALLLIAVLLSTSMVSFADSKKTRRKKAAAKPTTVTTVNIAPPLNSAATPAAGDSIQSALAPKLKRRHKVAIVPAPPPGQIPVYVPAKR